MTLVAQNFGMCIFKILACALRRLTYCCYRLFLKRDMSVQYLTPPAVVDYISRNRLYGDDLSTAAASSSTCGKEKERSGKTDVGASH